MTKSGSHKQIQKGKESKAMISESEMEALEELEYYGECRKPHEKLAWNFDGCQEFLPYKNYNWADYCRICDCHQSHHRKVVALMKKEVVEQKKEAVYTTCHKIRQDLAHSVDGCQEFLPASDHEKLSCAACSCHKSFHRNETTISTTTTTITTSSS